LYGKYKYEAGCGALICGIVGTGVINAAQVVALGVVSPLFSISISISIQLIKNEIKANNT